MKNNDKSTAEKNSNIFRMHQLIAHISHVVNALTYSHLKKSSKSREEKGNKEGERKQST